MATHNNSLMMMFKSVDDRTETQQQADFINAYMDEGTIYRACIKARIPVSRVNKWRAFSEVFKEVFGEILASELAQLEQEAYRRAVEGVNEPVFYKGDIVGEIKKYSDSLLMFLLKAKNPKVYRDKLRVVGGKANTSNTVLILPSNGRELPTETTEDAEYDEEEDET